MLVIRAISDILDHSSMNRNLLRTMSQRIEKPVEYYGCRFLSCFKWSKSQKIAAGIAKLWQINGASTRALYEPGSTFMNAIVADNSTTIHRIKQKENTFMLRVMR